MKNQKSKSKISVFALVLVLTISAILVALPIVGAHDPPWTIQNYAYITCIPNPVGVGQQMVIVFWPNTIPPTAEGAAGDRWTWTIEVTKPDNSKQTLGPITSDPVGGGWTTFTPDQVGTYSFVSTVAEHTITGYPLPPGKTIDQIRGVNNIGDTYSASTSDPVALTVQADPIEAWEETPLPTEYWTRPLNAMNRDWWQLAGNWLGTSSAAHNVGPTSSFGYGKGPESAHVIWATPLWEGGIMDARFGSIGYQTTHYDGLSFDPPIILNGRLYYNVMGQPKYGWNCLDLYTGKLEYFHNTTGPVLVGTHGSDIDDPSPYSLRSDTSGAILGGWLEFGQILNYESPNQHGGYPYLIGRGPNGETNVYSMFDSFTGNLLCSIANVSTSGTQVYGKDGSILRYRINNDRLTVWNTTRAIEEGYSSMRVYYWCWRPFLNHTFDGNDGFSLNVSVPHLAGSIRAVREGEFIIGGTSGRNSPDLPLELGNLWALSLEKGKEGTLLWNITFTPPKSLLESTAYQAGITGPTVDPEDGVFLFEERITRKRWGYNLETGEQMWGPTEPEASMNYYGMSDSIYKGTLFSYGYSGELIAYNIKTGNVLWKYIASNVGFESPYGNYPIGVACIADGKLYLTSSEHSPTQPLWRGSYLRCIDAETGDELWKINNWGAGMGAGSGAAIADGYLVSLNLYDMRIYCYGKGPSATTVIVSPKVSALGSGIMIEGTVIDKSAGTTQQEQAGRFPNGVPAMSDEDQSAWMEYVYMQQKMPEDAKGVTVKLTAIDSNGNYQEIGEVTSDMSGMFKKMWTPDIEGEYTIIATFEGSDSYYSSYAETAIGVGPAPTPTTPIEPEPTEPEPLITTEIAIIAAVVIAAIIGIVAFWALRRRK